MGPHTLPFPIDTAHVAKLHDLMKKPKILAGIITAVTGLPLALEEVMVEQVRAGSIPFWGEGALARYYFPLARAVPPASPFGLVGIDIEMIVCPNPYYKRQAAIDIHSRSADGQRSHVAGRNYTIADIVKVFQGQNLPRKF